VPPNVDRDNDLRRDTRDNCPDDPNPDQSDFDSDGRGDVCDDCDAGESADVDNDGIPDGCDGCIGIGLDSDMDMVDDACDDNACSAPAGDPDTDGDGVTDTCDRCAGSPEHDEDSARVDGAGGGAGLFLVAQRIGLQIVHHHGLA